MTQLCAVRQCLLCNFARMTQLVQAGPCDATFDFPYQPSLPKELILLQHFMLLPLATCSTAVNALTDGPIQRKSEFTTRINRGRHHARTFAAAAWRSSSASCRLSISCSCRAACASCRCLSLASATCSHDLWFQQRQSAKCCFSQLSAGRPVPLSGMSNRQP